MLPTVTRTSISFHTLQIRRHLCIICEKSFMMIIIIIVVVVAAVTIDNYSNMS